MLVIKKLSEEKLASLGDTAALNPCFPDGIADVLASGATVFVMLIDEKAVGALVMDHEAAGESPKYIPVSKVYVLPALRRHGLGRMLMCIAAGEAVERKVWFLGCEANLTEEAQAFADALHFRAGVAPEALLLDLSDVEGLRHA